MSNKIDQKEYLKRYLSGKKTKKSKKAKKEKSLTKSKGFHLADDFSENLNVPYGVSDEDEAPTIAEITYDNEKLKAIEEFSAVSNKWKKIDSNNAKQGIQYPSQMLPSKNNLISSVKKVEDFCNSSNERRNVSNSAIRENDCSTSIHKSCNTSPLRKKGTGSNHLEMKDKRNNFDSSQARRKRNDSDTSPPRRKRNDSDTSPPRRKRNDSDVSPPRRKRNDSDTSPPRRKRNDSDTSPPRRKRKDSDASPPRRKRNDSDTSPPRRKRTDSNASPPRRKRKDSDASPPRRKRNASDASPPRRKRNDSDTSPPRRKRTDSDASPPRRKRNDSDASPPRRKRKDSDASPPRRKRKDSDASPPRRKINDLDASPPRRKRNGSDTSPSRRKRSNSDMSPPRGNGASMLQSSNSTEHSKEKEFMRIKRKAMSTKDFLRSRKSDKHREKGPEEIARENRETLLQKEADEKYKSWNKGIVQRKKREESIKDTVHEMGKSFSRFSNDLDMNEKLKAVTHTEDPMLAYVTKNEVVSSKPMYKGPFPPNRLSIRPGYRWDGVDRSSGYENNWFTSLNSKKQIEEEAYKWSVDDM